jgi:hypothetical protein
MPLAWKPHFAIDVACLFGPVSHILDGRRTAGDLGVPEIRFFPEDPRPFRVSETRCHEIACDLIFEIGNDLTRQTESGDILKDRIS